jgi:hypothetical protein
MGRKLRFKADEPDSPFRSPGLGGRIIAQGKAAEAAALGKSHPTEPPQLSTSTSPPKT